MTTAVHLKEDILYMGQEHISSQVRPAYGAKIALVSFVDSLLVVINLC